MYERRRLPWIVIRRR